MKSWLPLLLFVASATAAQDAPSAPSGELGPAGSVDYEAQSDPLPASEPLFPEPPRYRDPRFRDIIYDPNAVVQLAVAPSRQMTVIFVGGERIESVAVGDSGAWQVTASRSGDSLFVKPTGALSTTNMTVITDARTYMFDLVPGTTVDTVYLVRFSDPETAAAVLESDGPAERSLERGRYRLRGARELRPDAIGDDGARTYIEWSEGRAMPAVFAIDTAGGEMLVDGYVRGRVYTIDRVYRKLIFRFDQKTATAVRR